MSDTLAKEVCDNEGFSQIDYDTANNVNAKMINLVRYRGTIHVCSTWRPSFPRLDASPATSFLIFPLYHFFKTSEILAYRLASILAEQ